MRQKEAIELAERVQRLRDEAEALQEHVRSLFGAEDAPHAGLVRFATPYNG